MCYPDHVTSREFLQTPYMFHSYFLSLIRLIAPDLEREREKNNPPPPAHTFIVQGLFFFFFWTVLILLTGSSDSL